MWNKILGKNNVEKDSLLGQARDHLMARDYHAAIAVYEKIAKDYNDSFAYRQMAILNLGPLTTVDATGALAYLMESSSLGNELSKIDVSFVLFDDLMAQMVKLKMVSSNIKSSSPEWPVFMLAVCVVFEVLKTTPHHAKNFIKNELDCIRAEGAELDFIRSFLNKMTTPMISLHENKTGISEFTHFIDDVCLNLEENNDFKVVAWFRCVIVSLVSKAFHEYEDLDVLGLYAFTNQKDHNEKILTIDNQRLLSKEIYRLSNIFTSDIAESLNQGCVPYLKPLINVLDVMLDAKCISYKKSSSKNDFEDFKAALDVIECYEDQYDPSPSSKALLYVADYSDLMLIRNEIDRLLNASE